MDQESNKGRWQSNSKVSHEIKLGEYEVEDRKGWRAEKKQWGQWIENLDKVKGLLKLES